MKNLKPEHEKSGLAADLPNDPEVPQPSEQGSWTDERNETLGQIAVRAVQHGDDLDAFMTSARDAYVRASPELREYLERRNILAQMEVLRRMGMLPQA